MQTVLAGVVLVAGLCSVGCGGDSSDNPTAHDVVETVDGRSAAHTLVALLSVRAAPDATGAHRWVHWSQIRRVRFRVDELEWGLFDTDAGDNDEAAEPSGWYLVDAPSHALVVAELGQEHLRSDETLDTVGDWIDLLGKHLAPGGHVAEVREVQLERDGKLVQVMPRLLVPFDVAQGDSSAFVGELEIASEEVTP